jgi:AraC-like DNA-binding protein
MPSERVLFDGPLLRIGHFLCAADEPEWRVENRIRATVAVFPSVPVRIEQAGRPAVLADRNIVMYYNEGQPYRRGLLHDRGDDAVWIALKGALPAALAAEFSPDAADRPAEPFDHSHGPSPARCYLQHKALADYLARTQTPDTLLIEESAAELRRRTPENAPAQTARQRREIAEEIRALLALDPGFAWSLEALVDRLCISPTHLCRIFKEHAGSTIHQYLSQLRLREAALAVLDGEQDLTMLALRLGYSTHSHFTDAFRRTFGLPPRQLREPLTVEQLALAVA